ncbi:MAG: cbb3-type cytochrome c oxidase N-terminal domain-containing protein [Bdellovibrionota bacterium]
MSSHQDDSDEKHVYDGIVELDNQLPRWWKILFYVTVVFGVIYYYHYEFGSGVSIQEEFDQEMAAIESKKYSAPQKPSLNEAKLTAFYKSPEHTGKGKAVFQMRCASCHGGAGGGGIGPNLTDKFWLHGDGKVTAIAQVVKEGVPEKGMPPWGPILSEEELYSVTAYIKSIKGTNPPGGKEPQGQEYKD